MRKPPREVRLRLRHPAAAPLKAATVNGRPWPHFDPAAEIIRLDGLTGTVTVEAAYEERRGEKAGKPG